MKLRVKHAAFVFIYRKELIDRRRYLKANLLNGNLRLFWQWPRSTKSTVRDLCHNSPELSSEVSFFCVGKEGKK